MGQQREEFEMTKERLWREHVNNLEARYESINQRRDAMEQSHLDRMEHYADMRRQFGDSQELKKMVADENKRHHQELEREAQDRLEAAKDMADTRFDLMRQRLEQSNMGGRLKAEYKAGLNVLHASLYGSDGVKGLKDYIYVLDDPTSRMKLAALGGDFLHPTEGGEGMIKGMKKLLESKLLTQDERMYIQQMNRAIGAINALRTVTGLPRATQQLMDRYILELPNAMLDANSKEALNKLVLIQREINAALDADMTSHGGETPPGQKIDIK